MKDFTIYQNINIWEEIGLLREVKFKASLSGGKGGQNVNRVHTKAELYWKPFSSQVLEPEVKEKIISRISSKLSAEGELRIVCEEERSQLKNKQKAIQKLYGLLSSCFKERKKRKATKPSKASVRKRLDEKAKQKKLKSDRKKPDY